MNRFLTLALLFGLVGCKPKDRLDSADAALIIGLEAAYRPFEYVDQDGQITGVSVEIGRRIAEKMGRKVEFRNMQFDGLIPALQTGNIDMIISSLSATDERRQSIDFSDPYVKTGLSVLVSAKSPIQTVADLKTPGRRIAVRISTTGETWSKKNLPDAKFVGLDTDGACVLEVVNGSVDAWVYDQISVMNYHAQHPEQTRALLAPLRVEEWAVGLRKDSAALKAIVNDTLAAMRKDGAFNRIAEKYLGSEKKMLEEQGQPFVFDLDVGP